MKKILIIGQAPPAVKQVHPYDTTLLYEWLAECDIDKIEAQEMFEFEAMTDKFPGYGGTGHKIPSEQEMMNHYMKVLRPKLNAGTKVILLGNVAKNFLYENGFLAHCEVLCLLHPSKRNYDRYMQNKDKIISSLKEFLK